MACFRMVKYSRHIYPKHIPLAMEEIPAHFDRNQIYPKMAYSLHTEYSHSKRSLNSKLIQGFPALQRAHSNGIPQLWKDQQWGLEFAKYISSLTHNHISPSVIEVHPPFIDYCPNSVRFLENYSVFEHTIERYFPSVQILIENRCGTNYPDAFLYSGLESLYALSQLIDSNQLKLRITLDIPQLYTAHVIVRKNIHLLTDLLTDLRDIRHNIAGIHLWGKRRQRGYKGIYRQTHKGDLTSYFNGDQALKEKFLHSLYGLLDDDITRLLVLEVNSENQDLISIINDLQGAGFKFV